MSYDADTFTAMTGDVLSLVSLLVMFAALVLPAGRPLQAPAAFTALSITETLRGAVRVDGQGGAVGGWRRAASRFGVWMAFWTGGEARRISWPAP